MRVEFTIVCGVDRKHLHQLSLTYPTWKKHKPSTILSNPMVIFYDYHQVDKEDIRAVVDHPNLTLQPWPPANVQYSGDDEGKWDNPQRHKMLAGFVHVPPRLVRTPYWLKLDTDVVATGNDNWIDPDWFEDTPAIISHPWCFTKPPDQILVLDKWVEDNKDILEMLSLHPPLNLVPKPGSDRVGHKRIISWCAFFHTGFVNWCSAMAEQTCGECQLPVPSQDGYVFYVAKRCRFGIVRRQMKKCGWSQWCTQSNIEKHSKKAMQ